MTDDTVYLQGYPTMPIDKSKLDTYINACIAQGITYGFGDKDPVLGAFPPDYTEIDCSGFIRTLIYYATDGQTRLPDGSFNEGDWLDANKYKRSDFESTSLVDNVVRICVYHNPSGIGHVWLVYQGQTYESHGSAGPSHRAWNNPTLAGISPNTTVWAVA